MSLRNLPQASVPNRPRNFHWDPPSDALSRWAEFPLAAASDDEATISIYDVIGEDWWSGDGFTAKRASAALRAIGARDVTVNVNSPGGDMFEGIAIYNLLAQHKGKVTVNVMGLAASAASIIAMAGDQINMGTGSFLMVHNAWGVAIGNQFDFAEAADLFAGFDSALVDIYEARTGQKRSDIAALMKAETYLRPAEAMARGFADAEIDAAAAESSASNAIDERVRAKRRIDASLAGQGVPRSERRRMMNSLSGMHDAAHLTTMPGAGVNLQGIQALIETLS